MESWQIMQCGDILVMASDRRVKLWRRNWRTHGEEIRRTQSESIIGANFIESSNVEKYISLVECFKDRNA